MFGNSPDPYEILTPVLLDQARIASRPHSSSILATVFIVVVVSVGLSSWANDICCIEHTMVANTIRAPTAK